MNKFVFNLKQVRQRRGLSQKQLARLIDRSPQAIAAWEQNIWFPNLISLMKLATVLNAPLNELISEEPLKTTKLSKLCRENGITKNMLLSDEKFNEIYRS